MPSFTTPVGRIVYGSLYRAKEKDADGNPLVIKSGPNAGKPRVSYAFGLAIPKGSETHWSQTEWGAVIFAEGKNSFPQAHLSPAFSWKVEDGDSGTPNTVGKKPCDREGFPGHWVIKYSSSYAPKIYGDGGATAFPEQDRVKPGHYVQVFGSVGGNGSTQKPGVFMNHSMVCFVDFGPEILTGADPSAVGFVAQRAASTSGPAFGNVPVAPNPAILNVPTPPPARTMTAAANGLTYEQYVAAGWTDTQLIQHGMMAQ